jgi:hypothetical protein
MGPQSVNRNQRSGLSLGLQGIDVEAAVGRKSDPVDQATTVEEDAGDKIGSPSGTPKREAREELEEEIPTKRLKEDNDAMDTDTEDKDPTSEADTAESKSEVAINLENKKIASEEGKEESKETEAEDNAA